MVVNLTATPNPGYAFSSWTGTVASASNASTTVTMSAPESVTANFTAVTPPSFKVSSSTTTQTVQPGGSAMYTITVTPQNGAFSSAITLAASGLPTGATATFSPESVTPGNSTASSTLTIQTVATSAALTNRGSPWPFAAPHWHSSALLSAGQATQALVHARSPVHCFAGRIHGPQRMRRRLRLHAADQRTTPSPLPEPAARCSSPPWCS